MVPRNVSVTDPRHAPAAMTLHPADAAPLPPSSRYFNRELSWLAFNRRVLEEACNPRHPLLERIRFLSISGSNLDEFVMVRVAGLKGQVRRGIEELSSDGLPPGQQLAVTAAEIDRLVETQQAVWQDIQRAMAAEDIAVIGNEELGAESQAWLERHFREQVFPVITPQALDPAHPFPFVANQGLGLLFSLTRLSDGAAVTEMILLPATLPRFIRLAGAPSRYIAVEQVVSRFAPLIFPGFRIGPSGLFRILRDSDIEVEEEAEDLVRSFRSAIQRRRRGMVIRLELEEGIDVGIEDMLLDELDTSDATIAKTRGLLGIHSLATLVEEDRPDLKFDPFTPRLPERIREHDGDAFAAIRAKDILVHHPYESFEVVVDFLKQAAIDPDVVAVKQTLYRAGKQSAVINALIQAAENGKSVTAVVELKARFDEEQNLMWASQLERAGVQVIYGFVDWKTHAKVSMVVRREGAQFRTYCHFGTGNYHPVTARIYTDLSFFTADPRMGRDAAQLFNFVTGYVEPGELKMLAVSPVNLRETLYERIDAEIANAREGRPSGIWAKMNALTDPGLIDRLYTASGAGVPIELVVRSICCLRPGVPGLSETIRVRSIVGRFLEHSRIWAFGNGEPLPSGRALVFISSADGMSRNLDRRVEHLVPIENPTVHDQILDQVMQANLLDTEQSWLLEPDGRYTRVDPGERPFNIHRYFMTNPSLSGRGAALDGGAEIPKLSLRRGRG
jgi:polyphosphate kinase